ncbi:hypothetical protein PROVRETT_09076 [Providencia rettgeri DSM 1131]|nr:hypothetical protein PROVRETT_09076 [Providencia rettgeri DSM 1131]
MTISFPFTIISIRVVIKTFLFYISYNQLFYIKNTPLSFLSLKNTFLKP